MPDLTYTSIADHSAFEERLHSVPQLPGVYQWKDKHGTLLYVGKSKNLRDRMRSYFGSPRSLSPKTRRLVNQIADFEIIVTRNELEALLLEMNLIKLHRPHYNILLKDDKTYPYIKVTLQEAWPRVLQTRTILQDGARYFGPYASAGSVRATLNLLNRLFAIRPHHDCNDDKFKRHQQMEKPCLFFDIKRCMAPCIPNLIDQAEYCTAIESVCRFLEGKSDQIVRELHQRMEQAAEALQFERAAYLRDQIRVLEKVLEKQQVLRTVSTDQDVIAFAREENSAVVEVFFIRGGKLIGAEPYTLQGTEDESDARLLTSFLTQFYTRAPEVPPSLLLAEHVEEPMIIEQWLSEKRGHKVEIHVPRRGEKRRLIEMAAHNATQKLQEIRHQWLKSEQRLLACLSELRDILALPHLPQRIECYDVSNTQGNLSVASMVVFVQGKPKRSDYRHFKIKTVQGANDVASIHEVIQRRFQRAVPSADHNETWSLLPDLILVDGGKGQLHAVLSALHKLGLDNIPAFGVAKGGNRNRFDIVCKDDEEPIVLQRDSHVLHLVQQIDEEAHRCAISYHRTLRSKTALTSSLDDIPGIGPKRRRALLNVFGSLEKMRQASVDELAAVPHMNRKIAEQLKERL